MALRRSPFLTSIASSAAQCPISSYPRSIGGEGAAEDVKHGLTCRTVRPHDAAAKRRTGGL
jgi:hypothetical protein